MTDQRQTDWCNDWKPFNESSPPPPFPNVLAPFHYILFRNLKPIDVPCLYCTVCFPWTYLCASEYVPLRYIHRGLLSFHFHEIFQRGRILVCGRCAFLLGLASHLLSKRLIGKVQSLSNWPFGFLHLSPNAWWIVLTFVWMKCACLVTLLITPWFEAFGSHRLSFFCLLY